MSTKRQELIFKEKVRPDYKHYQLEIVFKFKISEFMPVKNVLKVRILTDHF